MIVVKCTTDGVMDRVIETRILEEKVLSKVSRIIFAKKTCQNKGIKTKKTKIRILEKSVSFNRSIPALPNPI